MIAAHQDSIEHLDRFLFALQRDSEAKDNSWGELLRNVDLTKLPPFVQEIKAADIWVCPTLVVADPPRTDVTWLEEKSFVPPGILERYAQMYPGMATSTDPRGAPQGHRVGSQNGAHSHQSVSLVSAEQMHTLIGGRVSLYCPPVTCSHLLGGNPSFARR